MTDNLIQSNSVLVASRRQVSSELGNEIVIMDLVGGIYHGVDGVAAFAWRLLATPHSLDDLCAAVVSEYDVDEARCRADLIQLCQALKTKGLLDVVDAPAQVQRA